jgi:sterol desaturase/sphingolipid hydroxylase (fatty acid hydroxylase superfamily)
LGLVYSELYAWANAVVLRLAVPAEICLVYLCLELAFPRSRNSLQSYGRAALFVVVFVAVNTLVKGLAIRVVDADSNKPLALLDLSPLTESSVLPIQVLGWLLAAFLVSMVGNFFYYWLHRAQHAVPWLWRFHKVHHSIREMTATNSNHHVVEDILQYALVVVPTSFLFGVESGPVPWLVLAAAGSHSFFIHSSTHLGIGPLRYVLGDNTFHRIHHSLEFAHRDRNFGTATPLWDVLFGTAHFPRRGEWPQVGLDDTPPPAGPRLPGDALPDRRRADAGCGRQRNS